MILKTEFDPTGHWTEKGFSKEDLIEACGYIPQFLVDGLSERLSAVEAINKFYAHGGGWGSFEGFELHDNGVMSYPEDPDVIPYLQIAYDSDTTVWIYPYAWTRINDEVARID